MNKEEKEAIEWIKRIVILNKKDGIENTYAEITLNLIQKQDKIIDKMAEQLAGLPLEYFILGDKEEVKEYFKKVVDEDVKD